MEVKTKNHLIKALESNYENKYTYLSEYTHYNDKIRILCNNCNTEFTETYLNHFNGTECSNCPRGRFAYNRCNNESQQEKLKSKHGDMYKYISNYQGYSKAILIECQRC